MAWLFALGVIVLAVYHEGFRQVVLWLALIAGTGVLFAAFSIH
jgi:hypothetical protein